ncbi:hypothetical protein MTO96_017974 [Rhipicephalus appendiculatus]
MAKQCSTTGAATPAPPPGRSFSDALKGNSPAAPPPSATEPTDAMSPQADPSDAVMTALAAALRVLLDTVACASPARDMCTAALSGHQPITHHG